MSKIEILPIKKINIGTNYARSHGITQKDIKSFAESLAKNKFWEPPHVVKKDTGEYRLVAGFRRYLAAQYLVQIGNKDFEKREFIIHNSISDAEIDEINFIENSNRLDPHAHELAQQLLRLQTVYGYSGAQLAEKCNKSKHHINNLIRCAKCLHPTIINAWRNSAGDNEIHIKTLIEWSALDHEVQLNRFLSSKWGAIENSINEALEEKPSIRPLTQIRKALEETTNEQIANTLRWVLRQEETLHDGQSNNRDNGRSSNGASPRSSAVSVPNSTRKASRTKSS